jgi:hypothetical protein
MTLLLPNAFPIEPVALTVVAHGATIIAIAHRLPGDLSAILEPASC